MDTVNVVVIAGSDQSAHELDADLAGASNGALAVAGFACDTRSGIDLVRRVRPNVALVELAAPELPGKSTAGVAAIREIARVAPLTRILALTDSADVEPAVEALTAGAHGVLVRPPRGPKLVAPVLAVSCGHSVLHRSLLGALVGSATPREGHREADVLDGLSPQYVELWRMVADGLETLQIAERLYVSERTAKRLVASLLRRLKVANRIQAAALAGQLGLLDDVPVPAPGA
ncbi:MAG TPA: response regulator transcription factor [Acidimicrobiia bacterium]|nr:response regulator transcription factor [Acidimicrobiia bacterium]